jgi:hypothetical protein
MVYLHLLTVYAGPADRRQIQDLRAANHRREKTMIRKLVICAVIALILVPATVLAAGPEGQNAGAARGTGQCLQDGQGCTDSSGVSGGIQAQHRYGGQQNGEFKGKALMNGQGTRTQNQTRSMLHIRNESCTGCQGVPATVS